MASELVTTPPRSSRPDWLDRLLAIGSEPTVPCKYLGDEAIRGIREAADEDYRRIENEMRQRLPELYGVRRNDGVE